MTTKTKFKELHSTGKLERVCNLKAINIDWLVDALIKGQYDGNEGFPVSGQSVDGKQCTLHDAGSYIVAYNQYEAGAYPAWTQSIVYRIR